jgi:DNA-binding response OmpR family regulator
MIDPSVLQRGSPPSSRERVAVTLERLPTKLLYVEDDDDLRDMVAGAFVDAGFDVTPASSAERALELLENAHFDIVVTDYNLIGETGGWLLAKASASGYLKGTAAFVLTSERRPAGVDGYQVLRKPIDFGVLLSAIGAAVGQLLPAAVVNVGAAPRPAELELVLYVTSTSQESHKAIRNLHRALKPFDENRFRLTIIDVANGGDEDCYQSLEEDRVIVTPTLVRKKPGPKTWIVGTLSPIDAVEQLLIAALGDPGHDSRA